MLTVHCMFVTLDVHICWARSIQLKYPVISVQNPMDRFGPTVKVSKKLVHLSRRTTFAAWAGLIGKWPFHSTIPTHSHPQFLTVRYFLGVYHLAKIGGFSPATGAVLWHNCTHARKFAISRESSLAGKFLVYLLVAFCKNIQVSRSVFASRLRLFPPKPIRTKMLTFQPPTLLF